MGRAASGRRWRLFPGSPRCGESEAAVIAVMNRLAQAGSRIARPADAFACVAFRGYVADPDDHAWGDRF